MVEQGPRSGEGKGVRRLNPSARALPPCEKRCPVFRPDSRVYPPHTRSAVPSLYVIERKRERRDIIDSSGHNLKKNRVIS
uniref:Uncharacterized protein n=1 Tax=Utricularia reniformis TaxID=192314 RepID=A0A1Y0AYR6_9LAMI|nr:hypothetical protein AEK19_MT0497 [Utricularia reniformis]ART30293.1 hypothetical protein AEK19_MT0497 [Utricularia reniformis]